VTQYIAQWASGLKLRWRALTWQEYRQMQSRIYTRPVGVFVDIYRAVLLEGPPPETCPAGIADFVAKHVLANNPFSGKFQDVARAIKVGREELASDFLLSAKAMVSHLFHYPFEEIEKWDADLFFLRLAQAEFIAGKSLEPSDPKAPVVTDPKRANKRPLNPAQAMVAKNHAENTKP
jgi:hypothetical protein